MHSTNQESLKAGQSSGRVCGDCALCCKVMAITELAKPPGVWCGHARRHISCAIHASRPATCRAWNCGYLLLPFLGEQWYPPRSGMVVHWDTTGATLTIIVDEGCEGRWAGPAYAPDIARLDEWCRAKGVRLTIREGAGSWTFDPRGLSELPLFTTPEEDIVGLGPLPLAKAHISLRAACRAAQTRYLAVCAISSDQATTPGDRASLALAALAGAGLTLDRAESRIRATRVQ